MKAVLLFSGGLDSLLAGKLIQELGIKVYGLHFVSAFFSKDVSKLAEQIKMPLKTVKLGKDYIKMIRKPKHGYGKNINPCIDCKIFMLKKAKQYAKKIDAKFIITGDVLGERPMSQNRGTLGLIEKEAGLKNKILRPLSAKLLEKTEAEKKELIKREKLLAIEGRSRKIQLELAKKFKLEYLAPAGGCLLTEEAYAEKLKDLFKNKKEINTEDCELLKLGRHFRYKKDKIIVGRNEKENKLISKYKGVKLEAVDVPGPVTLLQGKNVKLAAMLTARYSDSKGKTKIKYDGKEITVSKLDEKEIEKLRI